LALVLASVTLKMHFEFGSNYAVIAIGPI